MKIRKGIVTGIAIGSMLASFAFPAFADKSDNGNMDLVHVGLNPATCGIMPGTDSGVTVVHSNIQQNSSEVNVSVHGALPHTNYVVDVRCVGQIGTLMTNGQGTGTAHITLPSALSGTFYIDISVLGGGGGAGGYGDTFIAGPYTLN